MERETDDGDRELSDRRTTAELTEKEKEKERRQKTTPVSVSISISIRTRTEISNKHTRDMKGSRDLV